MKTRDGFFGRLARLVVRRLVRFYYPDLDITGRNHLPEKGPLLLVANHHNSVLDPVMLGVVANRPVRFLAKAPLFDIPVIGNILHALGMVPVYRRSDDPGLTHRNVESLSRAAAELREGEAVGIFPEGKSHDAPGIDKVKSGAARLAIQAVREGAKDLQLVPIGLNYRRKEQFRSAVWARVGEPIDVNAWLEEHSGIDDRQAARELSAEIDARLKGLVVHLDEPSWEPLLNQLEMLLPPPRESRRNPFAWLRQRKLLGDAINHFMRSDRPRAEATAAEVQQSCARLAEAGLDARSSVLRWHGWRLTLRLIGQAVLMDLGFVLVFIGTIHHILPFLVTRGLARLFQAPGKSTIALVRLLLGIPIYGAWYGFHAWWISSYFLPWIAWAWLVPMPIAGVFALQYWRRVRRTSPGWWRDIIIALQPRKLAKARAEHQRLRRLMARMVAEFIREQRVEPLPLNAFSWRRLSWVVLRWGSAAVFVFFLVAWMRTAFREDLIAEFEKPPPSLRNETVESLAASLASDEQSLLAALDGLRELEASAAKLQEEFTGGRRSFYTQEDDNAIRRTMLSYLACRTTLLGLVWKYQKHAEVHDERLRWKAFLVSLTAASAISDSSLKLVTRFAPYANSVRKLNEADAAWGLPPGLFEKVRQNLLNRAVREFMDQSVASYRNAQPTLARAGLVNDVPYPRFHSVIQQHAESREQLFALLVESRLTEPFKEAGRMTRKLAYEGQAFVSTWLGSTRFRQPRDGQLMIGKEQLAELRSKLKPGDILIERQNWFLSRAFMPGYWAHAALYVGTTNDLVRLGLDRDQRVRAHWKQYAMKDSGGHEHLILEAVPQGVRMTTLEHCIGIADSAAVLRPRVSESEVREAIGRAFSHLDKSYDFDFDFFSSDKLVCTELVYRSYDGCVRFPLVDVMGRKTLPPTELVRKFVNERGKPGAQLECICFLDGDERQGKASFRDEEVFVRTLERPGLMLLPVSQR